ncbi:MAG: zinc-binding dehydrogenase [Nocardioides sp.]|nr:zinc-binding dehydrogenase [Nocardioides sp.]
MRAVYVDTFVPDHPVKGLRHGKRPEPQVPPGWAAVKVRAASLNHHDLWSLRGGENLSRRGGAGMSGADLPRILGSDASGFDADGNRVVIYPMISEFAGSAGEQLASPTISMLSGRYDGTFAEQVVVPARNLLPMPEHLSFEEAACLPTAWLTAYRMLFADAGVSPGDTILVQGAGGGLSAALILLGRAAGLRVWVTSRSEQKREYARTLGATEAFPSGTRLPERVDAVMDSVGEATWPHSLKALRKGGKMVVPGGTTGYDARADVSRIFSMNLHIVGSAMGSIDHMRRLLSFCALHELRPPLDRVLPLERAAEGFTAMNEGTLQGKVVLTV